MIKIIAFFCLIMVSRIATSQVVWTNKNVEVTVSKNTTLRIQGSLNCISTFSFSDFNNTGNIEITQNIDANSLSDIWAKPGQNKGKVKLDGVENQNITGIGNLTFENVEINKQSGKVILERDINITDSLIMTKGNIFLNSHHITLNPSLDSKLYYEKESSKIEDSLGGYISTKIQKNAITEFDNILGLKMVAPSLSQGIEVSRYHFKDTSVAAGSINRVYTVSIAPQEQINSISLSYLDTELNNIAENNLALFTREDLQAWEKDTNATANIDANTFSSETPRTLAQKLWITLSTKNCTAINLNFIKGTINKCEFDSLVIATKQSYKNYQWSNGSKASSLTVKQSNIYKLLATDNKGCNTMDSVVVKFNKLPLVDFRASVACGSKEVIFYNLTKSSSPLQFEWDLGDNYQSVETSPVHVYDSLIAYKVFLKAIDTFGCSDTTMKFVDIKQSEIPLKAQFLFASKIYAQDTVKFIHLSQPEPRAFEWTFGDGSIVDSSHSPNHVFNTAGTYTIRLIASNNGCTDVLVKTIEVLKNEKLRDENIALENDLFISLDVNIYPSPANKQVTIQLKSFDKNLPISLYAYNSKGQEIWHGQSDYTKSSQLSIEGWAEGIYMFSILQNDKSVLKKVVVSRF